MFVETAFWFHPLVWWIGQRIVAERQRAGDEEVLRRGSEPRGYAEGILNVCKLYVESPLACVAGVTGADLKRRIAGMAGARMPEIRTPTLNKTTGRRGFLSHHMATSHGFFLYDRRIHKALPQYGTQGFKLIRRL